jgi:hypothetical protein
MRMRHLIFGASAACLVGVPIVASQAFAEDTIFVPLLTYRTGAFANSASRSPTACTTTSKC